MDLPPDKKRFLFLLGGLIGTGFLAVSLLAYWVAQSSIRSGIADQTLPLTADTIYSEIQKDLLRPVFISSMMAHDTFVRDWIQEGEREPQRIAAYLAKIRDQYGINSSFLVSERSRTYYIPEGVLKTVHQTDERDIWYFRVRGMQAEHEVNLDPDEAYADRLTVFVNFKVFGRSGEFLGATGVGLNLDTIATHIKRYEDAFRRRIFFVDQAGQIILADSVTRRAGESLLKLAGIQDVARQILTGGPAPLHLEYQGSQSRVQVNTRFIPELSAFLVVEQEEAADLLPVRRTLLINLGLSLILSVLVLGLAYRVVYRYQERIETLARSALDNAARETELARSQQDFVAMVSHEFGTPMAIIDTTLQGLKRHEADVPEPVRERIARLHRASQRLTELMENYLTEDRLCHGEQGVRMDAVDLPALVERIVRRAEHAGLDWDPGDGAVLPVRGDAELLRVAVSNLVHNAIKHAGATGRIGVAIKVKADHLELTVRDEGPGIAAQDLPHVFEKYYRASGKQTGGVGLGLYLVRNIARLHGGDVDVQSVPGKGAVFLLRIPLLRSG